MLIELRDYIHQQGLVSSQQLAREFQIDEKALTPMLAIWLKKGVIQECNAQSPSCSSGCGGCKSTPTYYQMIEN